MESEVRSKSQVSNKSNLSRASKSVTQKSKITFQNTTEENDAPEESDNEYTDAEDNNEDDPAEKNSPSRVSQNASINNESLSKSANTTNTHKSTKNNSKLTYTDTIRSKPTSLAVDDELTLRSFRTKQDNSFYAISATKFSQFESMLFDLIGLPSSCAFKPIECLREAKVAQSEEKKTEIDQKKVEAIDNCSNIFVSNMNTLGSMLEVNVFNESQLKYSCENSPGSGGSNNNKKPTTKPGPKGTYLDKIYTNILEIFLKNTQ